MNTSWITSSHSAGRVLGIEVRILYVMYFGVLLLSMRSLAQGLPASYAVAGLLSGLLLPVFVFLHEMGHSLAAIKDGLRVPRILLHPLGGLAMVQGRIPGPMSEIMIALAGPFVSLLLAALAFLPMLLFGGGFDLPGVAGFFLRTVFFTNMVLALFNLLPIFPMDGGRVATALAVMAVGVDRGVRAMTTISRIGLVVMAVIGVVMILRGNFAGASLLLITVLLYIQGGQEMQARAYAGMYAGGGSSNVSQREPWAMPDWSPDRGFDANQAATESWWSRWQRKRRERKEEAERESRKALDQRVDAILAKVKEHGIASLTPEERELLHRASREYRR